MIRGQHPADRHVLVPPLDVIVRASTQVLQIQDPHIAAAVRLIREHVSQGLNVEHVLDHVPISRRSLETGFRKYLGHTPLQEILRTRIAHAQHLLRQTSQPIATVARRSGFDNHRRFATVFKQHTGQTPTAFRAAGLRNQSRSTHGSSV